jgi:hypothetical protein
MLKCKMFFLFARVFWLKLTDTIIFKFLVNFLSNICDFLCKDFSNLVCNQNLLRAVLESLLFFLYLNLVSLCHTVFGKIYALICRLTASKCSFY